MAPITCGCGMTVEDPVRQATCPACGRALGATPEKIRFSCSCGAKLSAASRFAGQEITCPGCGRQARVPLPGASPAPPEPRVVDRPTGTRPRPVVRRAPPRAGDPRWMVWTRYGLALALLPLLLSILMPEESLEARIREMVRKDPSLASVLRGKDEVQLFEALPRHRIEGAAFDRFTSIHWLMALISAMVFWLFILIAWPMGRATSKQLWALGALTGTVGIFMLLVVQWIALHLGGLIIPRSIVGIFMVILQFIGFSYRCALDPQNGFLVSFLGFTAGVGLCEETCKALPLLLLARRRSTLDARGLALLGLATGIGFGVSEAITYASRYYNGLSGGSIYVVRFVSCVALHAIWSASSALILWRSQAEIEAAGRWNDWLLAVIKIVGISMIFHGLYDTCLKRNHEVAALLTGAAGFVWFLWLYERTIRQERLEPSTV